MNSNEKKNGYSLQRCISIENPIFPIHCLEIFDLKMSQVKLIETSLRMKGTSYKEKIVIFKDRQLTLEITVYLRVTVIRLTLSQSCSAVVCPVGELAGVCIIHSISQKLQKYLRLLTSNPFNYSVREL